MRERTIMNQYTHLIWDFNGTLYDDVEASIESANRLLTAHGLAVLRSVEEYRASFGFPIVDYYRRLGFDFDATPYEVLAPEWVAYYLECSKSAGLYPDVISTLLWAKENGMKQLVLSATEVGMLDGQITSLGIRPYFDALLGLDNIHAHGKEEVGLVWREKNPDARPLMLGDTEHDAEVAAAMRADCILIARGHQSRVTLEKCACLFVADTLAEVVERIRKFQKE